MKHFLNILPPQFETWLSLYKYSSAILDGDCTRYLFKVNPVTVTISPIPERCDRYEFDKDFVMARCFEEIKDMYNI